LTPNHALEPTAASGLSRLAVPSSLRFSAAGYRRRQALHARFPFLTTCQVCTIAPPIFEAQTNARAPSSRKKQAMRAGGENRGGGARNVEGQGVMASDSIYHEVFRDALPARDREEER